MPSTFYFLNGCSLYPLPRSALRLLCSDCLCSYRYVMIDDPQAVLDQLREDVRRERQALTDLVGPLQVERFVRLLLGRGLDILKAEVAA